METGLIMKNKYLLIFILITLFSVFFVFTDKNYSSPLGEILVLVFTLIFGGISIISFKKDNNIHKTVFIIILLFGLLCVFASPINSISGEDDGLIMSELISEGNFESDYTIESIGDIPADKNIVKSDWDDEKINQTPVKINSNINKDPFYVYLASAVGVFFAKLLDLNNIWLLWLARLCNLILYTVLSVTAVRKTPILKMPMTVIACFPLILVQAVSSTGNAFIFGFTFIVISYLLNLYKSEDTSLGKKEIIIYAFLVSILTLCKGTFGVLALLILLIPKNKFKNKNTYYLELLPIILAIIIVLSGLKFNLSITGENIVSFLQIGNQIPIQINELTRFYTDYNNFQSLSYILIVLLVLFTIFYPIKEEITRKTRIITGTSMIILIFATYIAEFINNPQIMTLNIVPVDFIPLFPLLPLLLNYNKDKDIENMDLIIITLIVSMLSSSMIFISTMAFY